jgi:N-acetylmuramoyl-L-alanine amidase
MFNNLICIICLIFLNVSFVFGGDENGKLSVVVIDPGHGGKDPGASGKFSKEKDIVLKVGLKLGKLINDNFKDVKVIYTRSEDVFPALHERADIANRNKADLFISIHANANKNHAIFGSETYAMGMTTNEKNLEVAKKENSVITFEKDYSTHYEGYDPNSAESFIIFNLIQNTYQGQSLEFAGIVQNNYESAGERYNRGVKQAGFLVLWKTMMPSILTEIGYISNEAEEKYLNTEQGQTQIAQSIFNAFVNYKKSIENKSNFTVVEKIKDTAQSNDSLLFKIQILSSSKPIKNKSKTFAKCKEIKGFTEVEELLINNTYKYVIGESGNYDEVLDLSKTVKKYYPKSFIIALKQGKIIPLSEALKR